MAPMTTRDQRAQRWRIVPTLVAATVTITTFRFLCAAGSMAQVKAPSKNHLKSAPAKAGPSEDPNIQPFAVGTDGSVAQQLIGLQIDPADAQAAADAVGKALGQLDSKVTSSGRAIVQSQGAGQPKRLVTLQLFSAKSLAVELHRDANGSYGFKLAPGATEGEDERVSSLPSVTSAAGAGARSVVAGSVRVIKASSTTLAASLAPTGANPATLQGAHPGLVRLLHHPGQGRDAGGPHRRRLAARLPRQPRRGQEQAILLVVHAARPSRKAGSTRQGRRLGGTALAEPKPDSRISSPFGTRRYYGRSTGGGFHNGIDYEGKIGEAIYAAADGVINHQGWYFKYGRTVKISHADNFETLYAHMSHFAMAWARAATFKQRRRDRLCRLERSLDRGTPSLLGDRRRPVRRSRALRLGKGRQQRAGRPIAGGVPPVATGRAQGRRRQRGQRPVSVVPQPAGTQQASRGAATRSRRAA